MLNAHLVAGLERDRGKRLAGRIQILENIPARAVDVRFGSAGNDLRRDLEPYFAGRRTIRVGPDVRLPSRGQILVWPRDIAFDEPALRAGRRLSHRPA